MDAPWGLIGTGASVSVLKSQLQAAGGTTPAAVLAVEVDASAPHAGDGRWKELQGWRTERGITDVVICLPAAQESILRQAIAAVREAGLRERIVPPLDEQVRGQSGRAGRTPGVLNSLNMVELIGRAPYGLDRRSVAKILSGRRVLITGAGGSIGAELARLAATFQPETLMLVERAENALFEIDRQILARAPGVRRQTILHDIVDADATLRLFVQLRPEVVLHAAAHKHVPLMEDHPSHAVTNNVFGTRAVADAAQAVGAARFVLISSDKAVNPTSVMGATKRLAERYIQGLQRANAGTTRFSMVRFGNVLGSACSVLPIWSAQLSEGGPITVTDARMTRYFMTIHEAATLVLQAAALETQGSTAAVYVLDMGEPVRIIDLAQRFVRAHGFEPQVQEPGASGQTPTLAQELPTLPIRITGARPGEKLHEELAYSMEMLRETGCPGILWWSHPAEDAPVNLAAMIADLSAVRTSGAKEPVLDAIRRWVPEMAPARRAVA